MLMGLQQFVYAVAANQYQFEINSMPRHKRFEDRFEQTLIRIYYYYALLLGLTSVRYDFKRRQQHKNTWLRYWTWTINALTLLATPWLIHSGWLIYDELTGSHSLMTIVQKIMHTLNCLVIVYTVLTRCRVELALETLYIAWTQLERKFLNCLPMSVDSIERKFRWHFYMLYVCTTFNLFYPFLDYIALRTHEQKSSTFLLICVFGNSQNIVHGTTFIFNFIILWLLRVYYYLNLELKRLNRCAANATHMTPAELEHLCEQLAQLQEVHKRLTGFIKRLTLIYRYQLLAIRLDSSITLLIGGYVVVISIFSDVYGAGSVIITFIAYFFKSLQLFCADAICGMTVRQSQKSSCILRRYSEHQVVPPSLMQQVHTMFLQMTNQRLCITIFEFYELDNKLWFRNMHAIIINMFVLLQFHITSSKSHKS